MFGFSLLRLFSSSCEAPSGKLKWDALLFGAVPPELLWAGGCLGTEVRGGKHVANGFPFDATGFCEYVFYHVSVGSPAFCVGKGEERGREEGDASTRIEERRGDLLDICQAGVETKVAPNLTRSWESALPGM